MTTIRRADLFGKLHPLAYGAIENATALCKLRGNPYVELSHWLAQLLPDLRSDLALILDHYRIDAGQLARDVTLAMDRLPRGSTAVSDFSEHIEAAIERGWVQASLRYGQDRVRTGHLLLGMLESTALRHALLAISRQFEAIQADDLAERLPTLCRRTGEAPLQTPATGAAAEAAPGQPGGDAASALMGRRKALAEYCVDLTAKARAGELDPVTGRDDEIRQLIDILMRRRQNNPLLAGEAGVGKTAVVEGLALRIAQGDVPPALRGIALLGLDLSLLQAGAAMKGEFEQRLRQVIDEVQASEQPVVLFIDEVHTLIGAGGAAGTGDAANLLKPALARGQLRTIGATTWAEYKRFIEPDPALTRRFQVVTVAEPDTEVALAMLRGLVAGLESHHHVELTDEALHAAVRLSQRYIPARQLPDKAVALLDTACARVAVSQHATPAAVEDARRRLEVLALETDILVREAATGGDVAARLEALARRREQATTELMALSMRWDEERAAVARLLAMRQTLRSASASASGVAVSRHRDQDRDAIDALRAAQTALSTMQGESPLVLPVVDAQAVASVVAAWTGVPVGRMVTDERDSVLCLGDTLGRRVLGQQPALDTLARRIQTARAGLQDPDKPLGVFLLCGSSGVGKTETALALAEAMYGGEQNVITINMSEFQEAHTVSTLKGAPPGYVGYGQGGVLTEAVRRRPYSIVLLDEIEKAHPDVHELFFQVFDKGRMEDGEGRSIDFRNTVILLTSNVGSELLMTLCADPQTLPEPEVLAQALQGPLLRYFPAALLGRMVTVPYLPLSRDLLGRIALQRLERIRARVAERHGVSVEFEPPFVEALLARCDVPEAGGRAIDRVLSDTVLPRISLELLSRMTSSPRDPSHTGPSPEAVAGSDPDRPQTSIGAARPRAFSAIRVGATPDGFTYAFE
ncbi:type VI secretion system ATPase TssH [Roseateles amylovorans]|uniref:Type VI secretion system ATPase TssH n=1 Tax=Roseateles amylovorans TaxID=2978473 RepID=A0ABY6AUV0_9BURK|nr:type VI secretion system ATPase TssH [Roseateles amylovorans]UXH76149.1 type VI secretion system ATPase TssH [Roseateles amylovorans]